MVVTCLRRVQTLLQLECAEPPEPFRFRDSCALETIGSSAFAQTISANPQTENLQSDRNFDAVGSYVAWMDLANLAVVGRWRTSVFFPHKRCTYVRFRFLQCADAVSIGRSNANEPNETNEQNVLNELNGPTQTNQTSKPNASERQHCLDSEAMESRKARVLPGFLITNNAVNVEVFRLNFRPICL
jgi:hypothetical protein